MRINLGNTPLFRGMTVPDIEEMLCCLRAAERTYKKGAVILPEGTPTEQLGVVLSGRVIIEMGMCGATTAFSAAWAQAASLRRRMPARRVSR